LTETNARVRINRVRLKAGGADLRVLYPGANGKVTSHLRNFARVLDSDKKPPSAYIAVAYWADEKEPWMADYQIAWTTESGHFTHSILFERASALFAVEGAAQIAEDRVMSKLGYIDEPDESA
jgi:hypothetical protein